MTINKAGLDLIKQFEGFRAKAYQDTGGVWTIGYGTTAAAGVGIAPKAGMQITEAQATEYLAKAIDKFAAQIRPALTREPNENEWAAMVSLAYNIGPGAFKKSSVLRKFNAGDRAGAADAFRLWNKAGGKVLAGLTRRRDAERALFLTRPAAHVEIPPIIEHVITEAAEKAVVQTVAKRSPWVALILAVLKLLKGSKA